MTMCGIKLNEPVAPQANLPVASDNPSGPPAVAMLSGHYSNKTVLQTAKVKVVNNKGGIISAKLSLIVAVIAPMLAISV